MANRTIPWDELIEDPPRPRGKSVEDYASAAILNAGESFHDAPLTHALVYSNLAIAAAIREVAEAIRASDG